jgi:hypothetical protein
MPSLWFSYSTQAGIDAFKPLNSPYTITYNVGHFLRAKAAEIGYEFKYVNLDDTTLQTFSKDDIAVGHTWWDGGFMNAALDADIRAKIVLQPYSRYMVNEPDIPMVLNLWNKADALLLITGEHWFNTLSDGPFSALHPPKTRLDMGIDATIHNYVKERWNPVGKRNFLIIGNDSWAKGFEHIAELARVTGMRVGHAGSVNPDTFQHVPQFNSYGGVIFTPENQQAIAKEYDFFLSIANADANPTTLLETSAWGLIAACNVESGYLPNRPFLELRKGDLQYNLEVIDMLQRTSEYNLRKRSRMVREVIEKEYNWQRFCNTVWQSIESFL